MKGEFLRAIKCGLVVAAIHAFLYIVIYLWFVDAGRPAFAIETAAYLLIIVIDFPALLPAAVILGDAFDSDLANTIFVGTVGTIQWFLIGFLIRLIQIENENLPTPSPRGEEKK